MKLDIKAFALTTGLLWAIGLFGMTWWLILLEGKAAEPIGLGRFYRGYSVSPIGSLIGFLWALPDGFIGGAVFAWVYNRFVGSLKPTPDY